VSHNELRCLQEGDKCKGEVEWHSAADRPDGKSFPRCEYHREVRDRASKHIMELTSPTPAPWFDESYAGERWDED